MSAPLADHARAIEVLDGVAAELADIHRAKEYSQWRPWAAGQADSALAGATPFADFANAWIFTGDGGGVVATGRFGSWAIDRLVEKMAPAAIIKLFEEEISRNVARYDEVSPVLGVQIAKECDLGEGIRLAPPPENIFDVTQLWRHSMAPLPTGTCALIQTYAVTPAFERRSPEATGPIGSSQTLPAAEARQSVRERTRLACLLAGAGAVELPLSILQPDRRNLLAAGDGNQSGRPFSPFPFTAQELDADLIATLYDQLGRFAGIGSLARAIDRLGRSRLAINPVDRSLDLGMSAEIALMHDQGSSNTEIGYKIGSRAAWLLGTDANERATIFNDIKKLYDARSKAVHTGELSAKSQIDLDAADALVTRALVAILGRGSFPDWTRLVLGGETAATTE
ncbi:hypothetical protein SAMN05192583_2126 [Sphingomonas gellani]|uniref:Uncharacterized protein n=1 Tax=Sphingomonas gellani TaxID=1166340 RepID=A0A1H8EDZ7_9SPHN|nr:HEPN domain-containing protein [Sphingomonas gellani]SEN17057.1 hypothetical protein SAMN05192583_2126 [Sphingomonas gellani]